MSSELTRDEKQRIDDYLENATRKDSERLFPSLIAEETKVTLQKVVKRLRDLADEGKIVTTFEIDCPNCERTVERSDDKKKLAATNKCPYCQNTLGYDEEQVWAAFTLKES